MPDYTVADYLIDRLAELGARHLFHVPGNYTAQFLSRAETSGKLACVGTINELEAGYAADAYARLRPIGVACVTYGVGSFSLFNAIAGSYVERCPVVLINGSARADKAAALVDQGVLFAHAIDTLRTDELIFRPITAATAVVVDPEDASRQIDRVLRACIAHSKPVYLEVRDGVWLQPCRRAAEFRPLEPRTVDRDAMVALDAAACAAAEAVFARIRRAQHPVLWGGEELQRFGLEDPFEELVKGTGLNYTTTLMGKSLLSETLSHDPRARRPEFIGVYDSKFAPSDVRRVVENSDCIVALGTILSDFYGDIVAKAFDSMVLVAGGAVRVGREVYPGVDVRPFLAHLVKLFEQSCQATKSPPDRFVQFRHTATAPPIAEKPQHPHEPAEAEGMTWADAFTAIHASVDASTYVLADTSLALFPAAEILIPKRKHFIAQTAWLSIGYTVGAATGISVLLSEHERVLALTGDGGFQTVAQAFATLVKLRARATVVVFDNAHYAIEQFLVNPNYFRSGSTVPAEFFCQLYLDPESEAPARRRWDYVKLAEALGGTGRMVNDTVSMAHELAEARARTDGPTLIAARIASRSLPDELAAALSQPVSATTEGVVGAVEDHRTRFAVAGFD